MPKLPDYDPQGGSPKGSPNQSPSAGANVNDRKNQGTVDPRVGGQKPMKKMAKKAMKIAKGQSGGRRKR